MMISLNGHGLAAAAGARSIAAPQGAPIRVLGTRARGALEWLMNRFPAWLCLLLLAACTPQPETAAPAAANPPPAKGVQWVNVKDTADVEAAFAAARASGRPVFLYWGAVWCPPCNQVKSTIFTRGDFIAQSRHFVPVYLDGDAPSAQKLGQRFRVSGYPTMILLRADGAEVTRLAGAVEPSKYLQLLAHGLSGGQTARQALESALRGERLPAEDWRLLAYYAWETDEQQLVPRRDAAATLERLARACPAENREASARLALQAIAAAAANAGMGRNPGGIQRAAALARARSVIAAPELVRAHFDLVTGQADDIVGYATAPKSGERSQLVAAWNEALDRLAADASLPRAGRVWTVSARVALFRLGAKDTPLPATLLQQVREAVARAERATTDVNERQSVINSAGYALAQAGLLEESDALLRAELKRSHSPYYHMLGLASNAKKRGDAAAAIDWARQAFETAQGQATRVQWGGSYVAYLIELAPADAARIESAAQRVIAELDQAPDAFFARNRSVLERMHGRLAKWNRDGRNDAVLARLRQRLGATCGKLPAGDADRTACETLFARAQT
ncbi:MAG: thioredoxin family protein [Betaproteobacteria bacterium]|nr:MAG: thioredoxin family protein [Betaproteobacteria bacterium]